MSTSAPDAAAERAAAAQPTAVAIGNEIDEFDLMSHHAEEIGVVGGRAGSVRRVSTQVDGQSISGLLWGEGRPEAVFLHGGGLNAHTWDGVLLRTGYPALALDLPGHGRSGWMADGIYLPRHLAPLLAGAIRQHLGDHPVPVVGMSLGGLTGICLAAWYPEMVSHLVIVDVSPGGRPERSRNLNEFSSVTSFPSFAAMFEQAVGIRPHIPEAALRRSLLYNARSLPDGTWVWRHDRRDPPGEHRFDRVFADLPSYWEVAAAIRVPTVLVVGGRSPIVTPADVDRFRLEIPDLEVVEVAGAGHSVQGDRPDLLIEIVDRVRAAA